MSWTKLIRFMAEEDGKIYYGDCLTQGDIGLLYSRGDRIEAHPLVLASPSSSPFDSSSQIDTSRTLTVRKLLPPLSREIITTIRGLGLQFAPPGAEPSSASAQPPPIPCLFLKPTTTISGPGDEILIPRHAKDEKNDYEVELCVVIGDKDVPPNTKEEDAMSYVGGYTVVNDVSSRGLCGKGGAGQWGMGKNYDSWCPIGPCVTNPSLVSDPHSLEFTTKLNQKIVQKGNTSQLLVSIPKLIASLSLGSTLSRHSLILTGSPVAVGRKAPPEVSGESPFLKDGDKVECWVEGIGTLVNTVREENESGTMIRPYKAKL
ncbi:fumarylacetoacetate hydrolase family protein [Sporobolomyces salmoneus]|uniref:fumarylacetoacetate hydrolase family protein n=1 Tax=Sporobolomyces salmoneus TaxID=183962 RepID=UPI00317A1E8A